MIIIVYNDIMRMNDDVMGRDLISSGSSSSSRERARERELVVDKSDYRDIIG